MTSICSLSQPQYGGIGGVVGYLYESVIHQIKWHNLQPKDYINLVMSVGRLVYLSDEDFAKVDTYTSENEVMGLSEINNFAKMMEKIQTKTKEK